MALLVSRHSSPPMHTLRLPLAAWVATAAFVFLVASSLPAESLADPKSALSEPPGFDWERYLSQDSLTNDWFGLGSRMRERGLTLTSAFTTDLLGNPVGGFSQGFAGATSMGMQLTVDLDHYLPLPKTEFVVSSIWRTGENLSADRIGNLFTVAQLFGGSNLRLYEFLLRTHLFDDRLMLQAGRMGAFDHFLTSPINWNYINNGFDGNPKGVFFNVPEFGSTVYPTASWGAIARWEEGENPWYASLGGFLLDSENGSNSSVGLNWTFNVNQGWALMAETGWKPNQSAESPGLPGYYALGGFYVNHRRPNFSTPPELRSNAGFYVMTQQTVWRENTPENLARTRNQWGVGAMTGVTLFSVWVVGPDPTINQFPVYNNTGLVWQGILPQRPDDFFASGIAWGRISDDLRANQRRNGQPVQEYEIVLEANYRSYLTPFLYVQPGLQFVINPGAAGQFPNALVLGAQMGVTF